MAYPGSGAQSPHYDDAHRMQDLPHSAVSCHKLSFIPAEWSADKDDGRSMAAMMMIRLKFPEDCYLINRVHSTDRSMTHTTEAHLPSDLSPATA